MIKEPKLNSYVYVLTFVDGLPYCITRDKVYMKNNKAFIVEGIFDDSVIEEFRVEQYFKNYNKTWFTSLESTKKYLGDNFRIVKAHVDAWNVDVRE